MERVLHIQKTFGDAALAEEYIEGREFYVGVLGNEEPSPFRRSRWTSPACRKAACGSWTTRPSSTNRASDYQGTKAVIAEHRRRAEGQAAKDGARRLPGAARRDYGRIDLRLTETGEIYVIEVNANCYLEQSSEFAHGRRGARHRVRAGLISRIVESGHRALEASQPAQKRRNESATAAAAVESNGRSGGRAARRLLFSRIRSPRLRRYRHQSTDSDEPAHAVQRLHGVGPAAASRESSCRDGRSSSPAR